MKSYVRPWIDEPILRDADGQVIEYGNRWVGAPPEELYSVDSHPERFAPLHAVADALIAHLGETYDVEVIEGDHTAADLLRPAPGVVHAVRIQPCDPRCATLTFAFTAYPGIVLHAGLLHDFHYPVCGCDACDSSWVPEADDLEQTVLAIVTGHYREKVGAGIRPWVTYELAYARGRKSGRSLASDVAAPRLESARLVLHDVSGGWAAWRPTSR